MRKGIPRHYRHWRFQPEIISPGQQHEIENAVSVDRIYHDSHWGGGRAALLSFKTLPWLLENIAAAGLFGCFNRYEALLEIVILLPVCPVVTGPGRVRQQCSR